MRNRQTVRWQQVLKISDSKVKIKDKRDDI